MWQATSTLAVKTVPPPMARQRPRPSSRPASGALRNPHSVASVTVRAVQPSATPTSGKIPISGRVLDNHSLIPSAAAPIRAIKDLSFRRSPELGLLSLLFVLSLAIGSVLSLAVVAIPTMSAFRKLRSSVDNLSTVASQEVPGTLSSLKLSGIEISELTQLLSTLRQKISGSQGKKGRGSKSTSSGRKDYPFDD